MNSLRQSIHGSAFNESKDFHFSWDVTAGNLLLCYVTTSDIVCNADAFVPHELGYVADPGFPEVTISTPGLIWELLGTAEATASPYMAVMDDVSMTMRVRIYAAFNVPFLPASTAITVTSDGGTAPNATGPGISLMDFNTAKPVTKAAKVVSVSQDGSDRGPSSLFGTSGGWETDEPSYPLTAGLVATSPGDLIVVLASAARTYLIIPGYDYSGAGFTAGTSYWNEYLLNSPGGAIDCRFHLAPVQAFAAIALVFGRGGAGGAGETLVAGFKSGCGGPCAAPLALHPATGQVTRIPNAAPLAIHPATGQVTRIPKSSSQFNPATGRKN